jgi:hypothetical protein
MEMGRTTGREVVVLVKISFFRARAGCGPRVGLT